MQANRQVQVIDLYTKTNVYTIQTENIFYTFGTIFVSWFVAQSCMVLNSKQKYRTFQKVTL